MSRLIGLLLVLVCALSVSLASAHEMRPSLLELTPQSDGRGEVHFNIGYARDTPMALEVQLPAHCGAVGEPRIQDRPPVRTLRWVADCGLKGLTGVIAVDGLGHTGTDVIVRTPENTWVLRPHASSAQIPARSTTHYGAHSSGIGSYGGIGVEHILLGPDHLLFVLGLVILVGHRWRMLLATVTSFTVAHSVTLALSTLELIRLPTRAVEAVIAVTIVLLAHELARPLPSSLPVRSPWIFAWVCGLLHGFGFASVLAEVGLPAHAVPSALLGFNLGVELGQLVFVAAVVVCVSLVRALAPSRVLRHGPGITAYGTGVIGAYWFWERILPIIWETWRRI